MALPRVTRTQWTQIASVLGQLTPADLAVLGFVWVAGLLAYTYVLTAVLPGLGHAQALVLNVTGSAVSNVAPFGGAVAVAVTWGMARSWGFSGAAFALATLIAGVVNVLAKLALPLLGLLALLAAGELADDRLVVAAGTAAVLLGAVMALVAGVLSSEQVALRTGRAVQAGTRPLLVGWDVARRLADRGVRRRRGAGVDLHLSDGGSDDQAHDGDGDPHRHDWGTQLLDLRHRTVGLLRERWAQILAGLLGFYGSQALLQWLILAELGSTLSVAQVFAGYCFGRLLSSIVVTPGGVGIAETGAAGLLVALGGDPTITASGVLLFSGFAFLLEIPAGALGYATWATRRRWRRPQAS